MTSQLSYFHLGHITVKDAEPHINELYGVLEVGSGQAPPPIPALCLFMCCSSISVRQRLRAQVTSQDTQQRTKAKSLLEQVGLSTTNCIFSSSSLTPLPCSLLSRYSSLGHETWYCFTLRTFTSHYALPKPTSCEKHFHTSHLLPSLPFSFPPSISSAPLPPSFCIDAISLRTMQASHLKRRRWNLSRKSRYRVSQRFSPTAFPLPLPLLPVPLLSLILHSPSSH